MRGQSWRMKWKKIEKTRQFFSEGEMAMSNEQQKHWTISVSTMA
jgi:hypothetical protein